MWAPSPYPYGHATSPQIGFVSHKRPSAPGRTGPGNGTTEETSRRAHAAHGSGPVMRVAGKYRFTAHAETAPYSLTTTYDSLFSSVSIIRTAPLGVKEKVRQSGDVYGRHGQGMINALCAEIRALISGSSGFRVLSDGQQTKTGGAVHGPLASPPPYCRVRIPSGPCHSSRRPKAPLLSPRAKPRGLAKNRTQPPSAGDAHVRQKHTLCPAPSA